jgi:hypothetical protein
MTATRQDHITNALDHVREDSTALGHVHTALHELEHAFNAVETLAVGHVELEEEIGAVTRMLDIVRGRVADRIHSEATRAANLLSQEVVDNVRANEHNSVQWMTGNHFMPPLRSLPEAERVYQEGTDDAWETFSERFFSALEEAQVYCAAPEYDNALYCVDLRVWERIPEEELGDETLPEGDRELTEEWRRFKLPEGCTGTLRGPWIVHEGDACAYHEDPVRTNQSKHRDAEGVLRYDADDSEVFPGPTGVRKHRVPANEESIGKLGEWKNDA